MVAPPPELAIPLQELSEPESQGCRHPGDAGPFLRESVHVCVTERTYVRIFSMNPLIDCLYPPCIVHGVQHCPDLRTHDDGALDGELQVGQVAADWERVSFRL